MFTIENKVHSTCNLFIETVKKILLHYGQWEKKMWDAF